MKLSFKNKINHTLAVFFLGATLPVSVAAEEKVTIVLNSFFPSQNFINTKVLPKWRRQIDKATEGRVQIIVPPKSVAPPPKQWEALTSGLVDATYTYNGFLPKQIELPLISHLPWLTSPSAEKMSLALWDTYDKFFREKNEFGDDVVVLSFFSGAPAEFFSISDTEFVNTDQLHASKVWALPGATAITMKGAGVSVVSGPAVRIHEFVSHGVVDAFVGIPYAGADSFKAAKYVNSITKFKRNIFAPSFTLLMSKAKWNQISEKDRAALKNLSGKHFASLAGSEYDKANLKSKQKMEKRGLKYVTAGESLETELQKASQHVWEDWKERASEKGIDPVAALINYKSHF